MHAPVFASQLAPAVKPAGYRLGKRAYVSATPHLVGGGSANLQVPKQCHVALTCADGHPARVPGWHSFMQINPVSAHMLVINDVHVPADFMWCSFGCDTQLGHMTAGCCTNPASDRCAAGLLDARAPVVDGGGVGRSAACDG